MHIVNQSCDVIYDGILSGLTVKNLKAGVLRDSCFKVFLITSKKVCPTPNCGSSLFKDSERILFEKVSNASHDRTEWWNMFNISGFVSEFEIKASSFINTRHEKLEFSSCNGRFLTPVPFTFFSFSYFFLPTDN